MGRHSRRGCCRCSSQEVGRALGLQPRLLGRQRGSQCCGQPLHCCRLGALGRGLAAQLWRRLRVLWRLRLPLLLPLLLCQLLQLLLLLLLLLSRVLWQRNSCSRGGRRALQPGSRRRGHLVTLRRQEYADQARRSTQVGARQAGKG